MADPRTCPRCRRQHAPRWGRRAFKKCHDCRRGLTPRRDAVAAHGPVHTYDLGLLGRSHHAISMQATIAGGVRRDPSRLPAGELDAIRRRHLPTADEAAADEADRVAAAERTRREHVLAYVATPTQAAILAAVDSATSIDSEGEEL